MAKKNEKCLFMQILKGVTWFSVLVLFRERLIASNNNEEIKIRVDKINQNYNKDKSDEIKYMTKNRNTPTRVNATAYSAVIHE